MKTVILVPGTHAWDGVKEDWYSPGSLFVEYLRSIGYEPIDPPFIWDTEVGGIGFGDVLRGWRANGINLLRFVVPPRCPDRRILPSETIVISHSHGLQVVLWAAARGLLIDTFVDVAGPVREDMMPAARDARPNIRRWVHIHAGRKDKWQWLGAMFDGNFGIVRQHPLADRNVREPQADHGDVLRTPRFFHHVGEALNG